MKIKVKIKGTRDIHLCKPGDKVLCIETHGAGFHDRGGNIMKGWRDVLYYKGYTYTIDNRGIEDHSDIKYYNKHSIFLEEGGSFSNYIDKFNIID